MTHRPDPELLPDRITAIGEVPIRRALPQRTRRTVGAWCFVDHLGPVTTSDSTRVDIGPHPHIGLHTLTWLLAGEIVHTDSLGTEQTIRPGQLNLMTAGSGVAHAEDSRDYRGPVHGAQIWVAQPDATRSGPPAFEQQRDLPRLELPNLVATVLAGTYAGQASPTRIDTPLVGVDLAARTGPIEVELEPAFEHALLILEGAAFLEGPAEPGQGRASGEHRLEPGALAYLAPGSDRLDLRSTGPTRALLLGGEPFPEPISMWWNFVARTHDEIDEAARAWQSGSDRFGVVDSPLGPIPTPARPWSAHP